MAGHDSAVIVGVLLLLLPSPASAQYTSVHVDGSEQGQGTAVSRGRDCFVITAKHVVAYPTATVVGEHGKTSSANPVLRNQPAGGQDLDLAVLKVRDAADICRADTYLHFDVDNLVAANTEGTFRLREKNGTEYQIRASLRLPGGRRPLSDVDHVRVYSLPGQPMLAQGHSGGMFYAGGRPIGILTEVVTVGAPGGYLLRIDRISREVAGVLPLVAPPEEVARLDDAVAGEMLSKNINALGTREACLKLWELARWVARPEEKTPTPSATRRSALGGTQTDNHDLLLPTMNTAVTLNGGSSSFSLDATTLVGFVPRAADLDAVWDRAEGAIDRCLQSDARDVVGNVTLAAALRRDRLDKRTTWTVEATKGPNREANVWLTFDGRRLELSVWRMEP